MKKKNWLLRLSLFSIMYALAMLSSFAQTKISGNVVSTKGEVVSGVTIMEKGTKNGTMTSVSGDYQLDLKTKDPVLVFSYIGYKTKEIKPAGKNRLDVILEENDLGLNDVVVVGYGSVKKSDLTGSVSTVKTDMLKNIPANSIDALLQGRAAGLQIITVSDDPNTSSTVRIRGGSSLYGSNTPLVVVDGFPFGEAGNLKQINPEDIESIEILKDASASAIFGSRGANGVIMITTKKGKEGITKVNLKHQTTLSQFSSKLNIWRDAALMAQLSNEQRINADETPLYTGTTFSNGVYYPSVEEIQSGEWPYYTKWDEIVFRSVPVSENTTLGINSASAKTSFNLMVNYFDQQGSYVEDDYTKGTVNLGVSHKVYDFLTISSKNIITKGNRDYNGGLTYYRSPLWPVYSEDGSYYQAGETDYTNPVALTDLQNNVTKSLDVISSWQADLRLAKGLILKSQFNYKYGEYITDKYYPKVYSELGVTNNGAAAISNWMGETYDTETYLTYDKTFGKKHKMTAMIGHSYQYSMSRSSNLWAYDFVNEATGNENMASGDAEKNVLSNSFSESKLVSFMGRLNYSLMDKYLFTFTSRADGSSKFGANNKWAYFPSGAISWKAHEENFIKNLQFFDELKGRLSYGISGNQGISVYQTLSQYGTEQYYTDGSWQTAIGPGYISGYTGDNYRFAVWSGIPNEDLKWETTAQYDIGVDMAFFNKRLSLTFDYYKKHTYNLLRQTLLSLSSGYDKMWVNDGEINNNGFELTVTGNLIRKKDYDFSATVVYSRNRNKVINLGDKTASGLNTDPNTGMLYDFWGTSLSTFSAYPNILAIGQPVNVFYGYKVDGIIQTEAEGLAAGLTGDMAKPGEYKYVDVNGDSSFSDEDRTIIGNPNPDFMLSLSLNGRYKNFDAEVFINGVFGNDILNQNKWGGQASTMPLRWTQDNPNNDYPSLRDDRTYYISDWWIEDGSYVRIQDVSLGYNFKSKKVKWISNARFNVNISNLYTFTKFTGYAPEAGTDGIYYGYPRLRQMTLGLDITF
ncbi:MAG: TonB-dependent receptor [Bacteroidales bacterium]